MSPAIELRSAVPGDLPALRRLLSAAGLPVEDLDLSRQRFLVGTSKGEVAACAAIEDCGDDVLLRSLAVRHDLRGQGVGDHLCRRALDLARAGGARTAWLLTTTAEAWFTRRGFTPVDRSAAPPALAATSEFRSTCPASARCLRRAL